MAGTTTTLLGQMDDDILDGTFRDATDVFCQLAPAGHSVPDLHFVQ